MPAYSPPFRMTDSITARVIEIGELVGIVSVDAGLSPDPRLRRENRIRTVYSSLAIEQNTLSLDQVTDVLNGRRILGPPKDIREVKNAYDAYEHMANFDPGSLEDLLAAHRLMMQDLVPEAGRFRSGNVGVYRQGQLIHERQDAYYQVLNTANSQGESPIFVEFLLTVIRDALLEIKGNQSRYVGINVGINVGKETAILNILRRYPRATARAMADMTHLSARQVERILARLKQEGRLLRQGSTKSGSWQVVEDKSEGASHARI